MRYLLIGGVLLTGCSGGSTAPTAPSPTIVVPPPVAVAPPVSLDGILTATGTTDVLAGASVAFNGQQSTTNNLGGFLFTFPAGSGGTSTLTITGQTILTRSVLATVATRTLRVNAIRLAAPFDLAFYRQFVRNGLEGAGTLEPLRRWTRNPSIYLKTVDEAGRAMDELTLSTVETVFRDSVPQLTNSQLQVATIERGSDGRVGQPGWITVRWSANPTNACGRAQIAFEGGYIDFDYRTPGCRPCTGPAIPRTVIRHELGHALGFWHTDQRTDLMYQQGGFQACDQQFSARELYHAAIAYARPVGNIDPDNDPPSAVSLAPMRTSER